MSPGSTLRLATLALLWGSSFLFIEGALEGLAPAQIVLARMWAGALVLLAIVFLVRREGLPRDPSVWGHLLIATLIGNLIPYFLFGWAQEHIDSGMAGALNATTPLFTLALALASGTERQVTPLRIGGLFVGFLGALVVIAPWRGAGPDGAIIGQLACLLAAASYAISYVYMRRFLAGRGIAPLTLATGQLTAGALLLAIATPVIATAPVDLSLTVVASVLALGVLGTGLAYILNYRLIQDEGATTASSVTYLLPIVAVTLGAAVLGEPLTWSLVAGTAIVLTGLAVADGRVMQRRPLMMPRR